MKTAIIILHYGNISTTKGCVESIIKQETASFQLVIINNMPEALSAKDFTKATHCVVVNNGKNLGFAAGVNVGIRYALKNGATEVLLLNNDTSIERPLLRPLHNFLQQIPKAGIVAPAIHFFKNKKKLFDIGGNLHPLFGRTSHTEVEILKDTTPRKVTYASGCCMLIRREVFEKIGFFDEQFFLYYEDVDFCLRAEEKGFETWIMPQVVIDHELSKSAGRMSSFTVYHLTKSAIRFGRKYYATGLKSWCNKIFILFQSFLFLKANPSVTGAIVKALLS